MLSATEIALCFHCKTLSSPFITLFKFFLLVKKGFYIKIDFLFHNVDLWGNTGKRLMCGIQLLEGG